MSSTGSSIARILHNLSDSFVRLRRLLLHPMETFKSGSLGQLDALIVIVLLALLTALQKTLWAIQTGIPISSGEIIRQVLLAVLLGWGGLSSLFYFILQIAKKEPDFVRLSVLVAAAGLPLVLTTLLSVLIISVCLVMGVHGSAGPWTQVHEVIGWAGLALGWPGWFSAMALHAGGKIQWRIAFILCGILLGLLVAGTLLPALMA